MSSNQYFRRIFQSTGNVEQSHFKYLKTTVDLSGEFKESDLIPLSTEGLPYGSRVIQLGYNAINTLPVGLSLRAGFAYGDTKTPDIPDTANFTPLGLSQLSEAPAQPGYVNGGMITQLTDNFVGSPDDGLKQFPVLRIGSGWTDKHPGALITITMVYVCP